MSSSASSSAAPKQRYTGKYKDTAQDFAIWALAEEPEMDDEDALDWVAEWAHWQGGGGDAHWQGGEGDAAVRARESTEKIIDALRHALEGCTDTPEDHQSRRASSSRPRLPCAFCAADPAIPRVCKKRRCELVQHPRAQVGATERRPPVGAVAQHRLQRRAQLIAEAGGAVEFRAQQRDHVLAGQAVRRRG